MLGDLGDDVEEDLGLLVVVEVDRRVKDGRDLRIHVLAQEVVTDTGLHPGDTALVGQRWDHPSPCQFDDLTSRALPRAQGGEERVRHTHRCEVHLVVVVRRRQPLEVHDLGFESLAVHHLEGADRVDDVEIDEQGRLDVEIVQGTQPEVRAVLVLVSHDDGMGVHLHQSFDDVGSRTMLGQLSVIADNRRVIEEAEFDGNRHLELSHMCLQVCSGASCRSLAPQPSPDSWGAATGHGVCRAGVVLPDVVDRGR